MSIIALVAFLICLAFSIVVMPQGTDLPGLFILDVCKNIDFNTSFDLTVINCSLILSIFFPAIVRLEELYQILYSIILSCYFFILDRLMKGGDIWTV